MIRWKVCDRHHVCCRMLEEILESRFMIKKAMKDYKNDAVCYQLSDETIE